MSYTREVKSELLRLAETVPAELAAFIILRGQVLTDDEGKLDVEIQVNEPAVARRVYKLWKNLYPFLQPRVLVKRHRPQHGNVFGKVVVSLKPEHNYVLKELLSLDGLFRENLGENDEHSRRAWIRGAFISRGFINNPRDEYHLEISMPTEAGAERLLDMLTFYKLEAKLSLHKGTPLIYIKKGEKIADFLRLVGAGKALADMENIRIIKSLKSDVNRQVNCETANLSKTVNASLRQRDLLETLIKKFGWDKIPKRWRELAELRLEFPDSSLQELGEMMQKPLSKSGVAYRMKKLEEYARESLQELERQKD